MDTLSSQDLSWSSGVVVRTAGLFPEPRPAAAKLGAVAAGRNTLAFAETRPNVRKCLANDDVFAPVAALMRRSYSLGMTGRLLSIARRAAKRAPMEELKQVAVSTTGGIEGDFRGKPGRRQVTILFADDWKAAVANLDPKAPWTIRRANLLVTGVTNPQAAGKVLAVGDVHLLITGETQPCFRMDEQLNGLHEALRPDWCGGLTARVIADGKIAVGDGVEWLEKSEA
jgi:MOSC domain-containing protein YiiM